MSYEIILMFLRDVVFMIYFYGNKYLIDVNEMVHHDNKILCRNK